MSTGELPFDSGNGKPSLSKYFSDSSSAGASFFDQFSACGSNTAMMTSVRESASSQDLFKSSYSRASPVSHREEAATVTVSQELSDNINNVLATSLNPELNENSNEQIALTKEEPVVCRIFSSSDSSNQNVNSGKEFFDMISSGCPQPGIPTPAQVLIGNELLLPGFPGSGSSSITTSPDFTTTEGSFLTPSSAETPTPTSDVFGSGLLDDTFVQASSSSHLSEADRRRDAWIPSDMTRKALIAVATSPPGTYFPERELLTMPGVVLEEDMTDTVHEMVNHYLGEAEARKRTVLAVNDVTQDERGLRELIQAGCCRAAVNLTSRLLTIYGQGAGRAGHPSKHTVHSIQLWFTRLALLVKLRSFSLAEVEAEPFGDLDHPDLYFQFYPELYGGRIGSMVPFAFRLLVAELPQYLLKHQEALNRLHKLLATVRKVLKNLRNGLCEDGSPAELSAADRRESIKLWTSREARLLHSVVNCALYQKDYSLAVEVLELLIETHEWNNHQKRALQSALGRVYLQLGDVLGAERHFTLSRELKRQFASETSAVTSTADLRDLIDRGLMAVAQNSFQEAFEYFQKASVLDPTNVMLVNNMGVCLLYLGKLKEALKLLETAIQNNPTKGLNESLLLNICTLYELESSFYLRKKLNMLQLLNRYKGDSVYIACLKLQM